MSLTIGLNLLHALPEIGGGWNYISNLIAALAAADTSNEYVAYVTSESAPLVPDRANFRTVRVPIRSRMRAQRILLENTLLQVLVRRDRLDLLHWFANGQASSTPRRPSSRCSIFSRSSTNSIPPLKRAYLRSRLRAAVRRARMLLPMSEATATALHETLDGDEARMVVIPPIVEPPFAPVNPAAVERCRRQYDLPADFWLYVAHMYPHKNHDRLLTVYRSYRDRADQPWPLVLRGDPQPGGPLVHERVAALGLSSHVRILPRLPREELPALYCAASALVFPSLYEGAGIPIIEAHACGCPVVASDITAAKEFGGDAVQYFNPLDTDEIASTMVRRPRMPDVAGSSGTRPHAGSDVQGGAGRQASHRRLCARRPTDPIVR